jgi:hypoxanthine phosphoribosyltransferase
LKGLNVSNNNYDYSNRKGVHPISWEDFHGLCKALVSSAANFRPEIILPIGRGGYYPGTLIAHLLQAEIYPVRLSRRVHDIVKYKEPQWIMAPPAAIAGHRVLVVDEICDSGETLLVVKDKCLELGAPAVKCAVLYAHTKAIQVPDYVGIITDELLLNPWDREIFRDGAFHFHPEYAEALRHQGIEPQADLLIPATQFQLAKG